MSTCILSQLNGVAARKSYRCDFCGENINAGDKYDRRGGCCKDGMWIMHMHPECHAKEQADHVDPYWYDDMSEPAFDRPTPAPTAE